MTHICLFIAILVVLKAVTSTTHNTSNIHTLTHGTGRDAAWVGAHRGARACHGGWAFSTLGATHAALPRLLAGRLPRTPLSRLTAR